MTEDEALPAPRTARGRPPAADPAGKMTARQASAARTRETLISTGLRLAETTSLSGLSINLLTETAGVSKGTFFHHFGDRTTYLLALHREFHERIFAEILGAVDGMAVGPGRVLTAADTYLDACLRHRGVRALLLEARAEKPIADEIRARNKIIANFSKIDFEAMGWPHASESALLFVGLVAEAALTELDSGGRNPAVRAALARFIGAASTDGRSPL
jgi:TetR/AcrR family transcriptional regulator, transcriptional repressor for nem operon